MKLKLTETNIPALEGQFAGPDSNKSDAVYWDTEITGFGLRFRRSGKRTFVLQYKWGGCDKRMTLGQYPGVTAKKARAAAQAALGDKARGKDPQADKRAEKAKLQAQSTLLDVIDQYLLDKKPDLRPSSFHETERYLRKVWKPLHGKAVDEINRRAIANILNPLKHSSGKTAAARARSSLSALFGWAMQNGHCDALVNPVIGTKNPDPHTRRERVLSDDELAAIWKACDGNNDYDHIIRLLILTACRKSEVGGMRWSEFNGDRTAWTIPASRTKNGKAYTLPLPDMFWNIIDGIKQRDSTDNLFGFSDLGYRNWYVTKEALDRRCGVTGWTHHDLRRTVATVMAESPPDEEHPKRRGLGVFPHVVEALLNHVSGHKSGVAGIYNRARYQPQVKTALARWAEYVASITSGEERKILQFPAETK